MQSMIFIERRMSINHNIYPKVEMNPSKVKREKMAYKKKMRNRFITVMEKILQLDARAVQDGKTGHCNNKRCYYKYKSKLQ